MKKIIILSTMLLLLGAINAQQTLPKGINKPVNNAPRINTTPVATNLITKQTVTITPTSVSNLCPWVKTRGDNDFDGHEVYVTVNINFNYNMRLGDSVLRAKISLTGRENSGDGSEVRGDWTKVVYRAPAGWRIKNISNGTNSLVAFFSFNANATQRYTGGTCPMRIYQLNPNNLGLEITSTILQNIKIAVDKYKTPDFDEVESTCDCGFKIMELYFKPLSVELEKIP